MTIQLGLFPSMRKKELKDYYWACADILRDIGMNESVCDQHVMALKLLIANQAKDTQTTSTNILTYLKHFKIFDVNFDELFGVKK